MAISTHTAGLVDGRAEEYFRRKDLAYQEEQCRRHLADLQNGAALGLRNMYAPEQTKQIAPQQTCLGSLVLLCSLT